MWTPEVNNALNDSINNPQSSSAKAAENATQKNKWFWDKLRDWAKNQFIKNNSNVATLNSSSQKRNAALDDVMNMK